MNQSGSPSHSHMGPPLFDGVPRRWGLRVAGGFAIAAVAISPATETAAQVRSDATGPEIADCAACTMQTRRRIVLGAQTDSELPVSVIMDAKRSSDGRYFLHAMDEGLLVYGADGAFLHRIGRLGRGPGEITAIRGFSLGPHDTLRVYDNRRVVLVFGPSGSFVRQGPIAFLPTIALPLPSGQTVAYARVNTRAAAGYPLHVIGMDGRWAGPFGPDTAVLDPTRPGLSGRWIAQAPDGTIWSLHTNSYTLEQLSVDGKRVRLLRRTPGWLTAPPRPPSVNAPSAAVRAIHIGRDGRVWVLGVVPNPDFRPRASLPPGATEREYGGAMTSQFLDARWRSIIELIDPATRRVVGRAEVPFWVQGFVDDGLVLRAVTTDAGYLVPEVWALSVVSP